MQGEEKEGLLSHHHNNKHKHNPHSHANHPESADHTHNDHKEHKQHRHSHTVDPESADHHKKGGHKHHRRVHNNERKPFLHADSISARVVTGRLNPQKEHKENYHCHFNLKLVLLTILGLLVPVFIAAVGIIDQTSFNLEQDEPISCAEISVWLIVSGATGCFFVFLGFFLFNFARYHHELEDRTEKHAQMLVATYIAAAVFFFFEICWNVYGLLLILTNTFPCHNQIDTLMKVYINVSTLFLVAIAFHHG